MRPESPTPLPPTSQSLMQQASWNLCPQKTAYSGSCYYSNADQTFSSLSGTSTSQILDAPDGTWNLVVKRDIFNKVQGAVRDMVKLAAGSYYYKVSMQPSARQKSTMSCLQFGWGHTPQGNG